MKAYLLLANGMVFEGRAFGAAGTSVGEVVFNTGMVGYEETLTDPSYYGQIITQTYPLVGNYGVNGEDAESARIWAFGYIVRELCGTPSNFRCQKTLDEFLKEQGIIGIAGVDTRRLTRIIRESGVMNGALTTEYKSADAVRADAALMEKIKAYTVKDAVDSVTTKCMETFNENGKYHVALFDFGYKRNILRNLVKRGCKVTLVPGRTTAAELAALEVDGVMLSNGPGDPAENVKIIENLKEIEALGVQSICVKDMAGIMSPKEAYDLVTALKKEIKVPIVIHTHNTTGLGPMTLMKAVEAGADVIDTAVSCFSGGTSQPPTETLVYALREMGYEISVKDDVVKKINDFFKPIRAKYLANGLLNPVVMGNATDALIYQVPGGMLSNLVAQLTAQKALDKLDAVLLEVPKVRKDLGYPPLVTPMSQMVGVQATVNVLTGGRYKNVSKEIKAYVKGEYGRAPGKIDPEVQKLVLGDEKPITQRYADLLEPGFEKAKRELGERAHSDEDVLSYIAFPAQAEAYFEKRDRKEDDNEIHFSIREVK